ERDLGRRCVAGQAERMIELADLEGANSLAHDRLDRGFPARFDMQVLPEPLHALEPVVGQPWADLRLAVDALLQLAQCRDPGFDLGEFGLGFAQRVVRRRATRIVLLPLRTSLLELRSRFFFASLEFGQFGPGILERYRIELAQHGRIRRQPLAALLDAFKAFLRIALLEAAQLQAAADLGDFGLPGIERFARLAKPCLEGRRGFGEFLERLLEAGVARVGFLAGRTRVLE